MRKLLILSLCLLGPVWAQAPTIPASQLESLRDQQDPYFLDVRSQNEIQELGTLPDYHNIPLEELEKRLDELPKDRLILTA